MFRPILGEVTFIGLFLQGLLYGLYSGIFAMYLQYQASNKTANKTQNIIFYSLCALYVLSVSAFVCDIAGVMCQLLRKPPDSLLHVDFIQMTSFACCDLIAQFILIYRCWIVWGRNIQVVIIPVLLAFAFLAIWLVGGSSMYMSSQEISIPHWMSPMCMAGVALSLTDNALVTGLIVFKIFKVFMEVRATSDDQILGAPSGSKLRRIIFILIESGMALFSIQLARLVVSIMWTDTADRALNVIIGIHEMLTGIIPTITLVRTSMGLSFDNEKSMEEVAIGSLRFGSNYLNSVPETGSIGIIGQNNGNDDDIDEDMERLYG